MLKSSPALPFNRVREMKCPECGSRGIRKEDDGKNIVIFCGDCGLVIEDEIVVA